MAGEITVSGIGDGMSSRHDPPAADQVAICREWIDQFCTPREAPSWFRSYCLKHVVEQYLRSTGRPVYVSQGAFIQAALACGYEPIPSPPGARFCFWIHEDGFKGSEHILAPHRLTDGRV